LQLRVSSLSAAPVFQPHHISWGKQQRFLSILLPEFQLLLSEHVMGSLHSVLQFLDILERRLLLHFYSGADELVGQTHLPA
jgi:hypothetical protein